MVVLNSCPDIQLSAGRFLLPLGEVVDEDVKTPRDNKAMAVNLSTDSKAILRELQEKTGVPMKVALERLLTWFADQDMKFRLAVFVNDNETRDDLVGIVLQQMRGGIPPAGPDGVAINPLPPRSEPESSSPPSPELPPAKGGTDARKPAKAGKR